MRPEDVRAPKDRIRNPRVIYTNPDEAWSIAEMEWRDTDTDRWSLRVGMRWDGREGELGNPQSSGHPTWFLLPEGEISHFALQYAEERS